MIRHATLADIPELLELSYEVHGKTHYRAVPLDERVYTGTLRRMIASKQHCVLLAKKDDELVGFLLGITQQVFFSRKKYATDLVIYVKPDSGTAGAQLVMRFLAWARSQPGVLQIILGVSSDIVDEQKVDQLYKRYGLRRTGGLYVQDVQKEDVAA